MEQHGKRTLAQNRHRHCGSYGIGKNLPPQRCRLRPTFPPVANCRIRSHRRRLATRYLPRTSHIVSCHKITHISHCHNRRYAIASKRDMENIFRRCHTRHAHIGRNRRKLPWNDFMQHQGKRFHSSTHQGKTHCSASANSASFHHGHSGTCHGYTSGSYCSLNDKKSATTNVLPPTNIMSSVADAARAAR